MTIKTYIIHLPLSIQAFRHTIDHSHGKQSYGLHEHLYWVSWEWLQGNGDFNAKPIPTYLNLVNLVGTNTKHTMVSISTTHAHIQWNLAMISFNQTCSNNSIQPIMYHDITNWASTTKHSLYDIYKLLKECLKKTLH